MNVLALLQDRFQAALRHLAVDQDDAASLSQLVAQAQDPRFGDYQANLAMPLAKKLGQAPREVARQIVELIDLGDVCKTPEIAGPGFINLRLTTDWLQRQLEAIRRDERLGVAPSASPRTFVIDYSAPNIAKPMHVGHIRSTVIGDALYRTLKFLGHRVISDNHVGDWGTQFGMIIHGYRHFVDRQAYERNPVTELGRVYREVRSLMDFHDGRLALPAERTRLEELREKLRVAAEAPPPDDAKARKKAKKQLAKLEDDLRRQSGNVDSLEAKLRAVLDDPVAAEKAERHAGIQQAVLDETAKLHAHDAENLKLWREFLPKCRDEINRIYQRLDVTFDEELGESFYHDRLAQVVGDLQSRGLARESEGAMCVFLDGFEAPMIVRKQDGAFLYATTDMATIQYRMERWRPDAILYVVDFRQGEHFGKLFTAARAWGYDQVDLKHVSFGTVLGEDGKPFKTRSGEIVSLEGLLDEAVARARQVVSENDDAKPGGPELSPEDRGRVANVIGHAAIKYADLSQNRVSDYVFNYDKMVSMQGNTATYLQYSYARIQNIFARGSVDVDQLRTGPSRLTLTDDRERSLALRILRLEEALAEAMVDYRPNILATYLYQLSKSFADFYEACPVLKAEDVVRDSRLLLCDLTARTLRLGLSLLGIQVVNRM